MQTTKWVSWSQWANGKGMVDYGQMPICDIGKNLRRFEQKAAKLLKESGADHVVYGLKIYNENGELDNVKFYLHPISDEEFQRDVATLTGCTVYALHKR